MQYMLLLYSDHALAPAENSPEAFAEFGEWMAYTQAMREAGVHVAGEPLQREETATTVRVRAGETLLVDGPFTETKEQLGGYYVIEVPDLDAAVEWASRVPNVHYGSVEVRPVMVIPDEARSAALDHPA